MTHLLIVGALEAEIDSLPDLLRPNLPADVTVTCATVGVGKVTAAEMTQRHLLLRKPDMILFAGVAGALEDDLMIGDVGVVEAAIDADLDVRSWRRELLRAEHPITRERLHRSDPGMVARALEVKHALDGTPLRTFSAFATSGSEFFDTEGKARFIRTILPDLEATLGSEKRRPNVIDMETSAFLQVASHNGIPALALRAVSDTTTGNAVEDFERFLARASLSYAAVIQQVALRGQTVS
ncbi:MAG: 5'-methylthioadenosine/S-adenosylhomocysteine nucleosidase [Opitutaceae bacterium]|nr:5'-methylthioadenosine/S-adenosylhomocysteine nucleosidase [Opitutaceae bacterium]